jgi:hypothetical protein
LSDREPRGLEEGVFAVHAPRLTHQIAERHSIICRKSRDTRTVKYGLRKMTIVDGGIRSRFPSIIFGRSRCLQSSANIKEAGRPEDRPTRQGRNQDSRIRQAACQSAVLIRTPSRIFLMRRV